MLGFHYGPTESAPYGDPGIVHFLSGTIRGTNRAADAGFGHLVGEPGSTQRFGQSVALTGDVGGDGVNDLVVGAPM